MKRTMTFVTLLAAMVAVDAAPTVLEDPGLYRGISKAGKQTPPDMWTTSPDLQGIKAMATSSLDRLLKTITTNPDGRIKIVPARSMGSEVITDKTTFSPKLKDKTGAGASSLGALLKIASETIDLKGQEKTEPANRSFDKRFSKNPAIGDPTVPDHTTAENTGFHRRSRNMSTTTDSNKKGKSVTNSAERRLKITPVTDVPGRREKILKMLTALEELQRTINSTRTSRITLMPRGNNQKTGKKGKTPVADGNMKSTAVPSVVSSSSPPRNTTDPDDPKTLNGKAIKKSVPGSPKKTNKRVCFWKYCSQN